MCIIQNSIRIAVSKHISKWCHKHFEDLFGLYNKICYAGKQYCWIEMEKEYRKKWTQKSGDIFLKVKGVGRKFIHVIKKNGNIINENSEIKEPRKWDDIFLASPNIICTNEH